VPDEEVPTFERVLEDQAEEDARFAAALEASARTAQLGAAASEASAAAEAAEEAARRAVAAAVAGMPETPDEVNEGSAGASAELLPPPPGAAAATAAAAPPAAAPAVVRRFVRLDEVVKASGYFTKEQESELERHLEVEHTPSRHSRPPPELATHASCPTSHPHTTH